MSADSLPNPFVILKKNAERNPERIALKLPHSSISYPEFLRLADAYAEILLNSGFQPGFKVIVMVKPGLELYALAFALFKLKGTPVIVDPGMGLKRILASYKHVGADVFIGLPLTQIIRKFAKESFATIRLVYSVKGRALKVLQGTEPKTRPETPVPVTRKDLAFITFTTGSTGPAKAVEATFGMLDAAVHIIRTEFEQGENEKDLVSMPFFGLISLMIGSTVVIPKMNPGKPAHIDPRIIAETLQNEGITVMLASPAFYDKLSSYAEHKGIIFPKLKIMSSGGAPMTLAIMQRCEKMLSPQGKFFVCWGATEGLPLAFINVQEIESLKHTVIAQGLGSPLGRPVSGVELAVIRIQTGDAKTWETREPMPQGELGEIIATGENVSKSYYRDEQANRGHKLIDTEGRVWHRTGDIGFIDSAGRVIFTGRMAHLVRNDDEILHSVACEGVSNNHPEVKRSALVEVSGKAVMVIELFKPSKNKDLIKKEVLALLHANPITQNIARVDIHRNFPVDPRHNAKIERAKLAVWAARNPSLSLHAPKLIPILGWLFVFIGPFYRLEGFWLGAWWLTLFLSTIAHIVQIPRALPYGELYGYSKRETTFWTLVFGATFWKPLALATKRKT